MSEGTDTRRNRTAGLANYRDRIYENYASNFQDLAPQFDIAASRTWGRAYRHYLRHWLPGSRDATILDVACGGGRLLHFLKEQGYRRLEGVDLSPEQVAIARQVIPDVVKGNAIEFLDHHANEFDLITGLDIVEHLCKAEVIQFLDAAFRALRKDGRLVLQTPNADSPWGTMHRYNDFTHEVCFNANALGRLLKLVGFNQVESREMGPVPFSHSLASTVRAGIWQCFRLVFKIWSVAELGSAGSGVFTRVFLISGVKR
jgi:2-polyprenyl-3-methyl-5-hydroxy-6-metoxy-1,4-benzoquinol methylase